METPSQKDQVKALAAEIKSYITLRIQVGTLQLKRTLAITIGSVSGSIFIILFASMAFLFGSFALAYVIGEYLQSIALGFLSVTGLYTFLCIVFLALRKTIQKKVANSMIKVLFNDENNA
jgi:hypothetical protein